MTSQTILSPLLACSLLVPASAIAAPPEDTSASGSVSLGAEGPETKVETTSKYGKRKDQKWIKRWAPEKNMVEIGVYGGVLLLANSHELFRPDLDLPMQGYKPLRTLNPDLGLRVGYYPIRFFGIEAEGGVMPSKLRDDTGNALMYTMRGHLVAQLGLWSVTPFVLIGAGGLGVSSPRASLGSDLDPALHVGGGVKIYINRWVMLRLDLRDIVSHQQGVDETFKSHNFEGLLGLSITLGRKKDQDSRRDTDGDGFWDDQDACVTEPGVSPDGCPPADGDRDGDGIMDPEDACKDDPETVNDYQDEDGCPETDRDSDGFLDDKDTCPDEAGVEPDGCPIRDADGDGILDPDDACKDDPETKNGYQDTDGCPDEVPTELAKFTGAIKGITFDTNKDAIKSSSKPTLDNAVKVLKDFPDIRIEVAGHTDSQGEREHNIDLSRRRADAVKKYLVDNGIDASRIETTGHGPDKAVDTNDTKPGRANNRRIEFTILH